MLLKGSSVSQTVHSHERPLISALVTSARRADDSPMTALNWCHQKLVSSKVVTGDADPLGECRKWRLIRDRRAGAERECHVAVCGWRKQRLVSSVCSHSVLGGEAAQRRLKRSCDERLSSSCVPSQLQTPFCLRKGTGRGRRGATAVQEQAICLQSRSVTPAVIEARRQRPSDDSRVR